MAKIIVSEFVTLDGVVESPEKWSLAYWCDDIASFKQPELFACGALLLGRVTYEGFARAWPDRKGSDGYADRINSMPKYVVSSTLTAPTWNATAVGGQGIDRVRALKQSAEGDLLVFGSIQLASALIEQGLADELRLLTYPLIRGTGRRLFREGMEARLALVETRRFSSGAVLLTYQPAASAA